MGTDVASHNQVIDGLNKVLPGVISGVNDAVQDFTKGINSATGAIDSVLKTLNVPVDIPKFDSPNLNKLVNTTSLIPSTPIDAINNLNSSLPTLKDLQTMLANQSVLSSSTQNKFL